MKDETSLWRQFTLFYLHIATSYHQSHLVKKVSSPLLNLVFGHFIVGYTLNYSCELDDKIFRKICRDNTDHNVFRLYLNEAKHLHLRKCLSIFSHLPSILHYLLKTPTFWCIFTNLPLRITRQYLTYFFAIFFKSFLLHLSTQKTEHFKRGAFSKYSTSVTFSEYLLCICVFWCLSVDDKQNAKEKVDIIERQVNTLVWTRPFQNWVSLYI